MDSGTQFLDNPDITLLVNSCMSVCLYVCMYVYAIEIHKICIAIQSPLYHHSLGFFLHHISSLGPCSPHKLGFSSLVSMQNVRYLPHISQIFTEFHRYVSKCPCLSCKFTSNPNEASISRDHSEQRLKTPLPRFHVFSRPLSPTFTTGVIRTSYGASPG